MKKREENKSKSLSFKILKISGMGVLLVAVSILAPIFPYLLLKAYLRKMFGDDYKVTQLRNSVKYLKQKKFIAFRNKKFALTKLGKKYLKKRRFKRIKSQEGILGWQMAYSYI
jgi:hypothetical protein